MTGASQFRLRIVAIVCVLLMSQVAYAQTPDGPRKYRDLADKAHLSGDIASEVIFRKRAFDSEWIDPQRPKHWDRYDEYGFVFLNDMPLARVLTGLHRFSEAEEYFQHSRMWLKKSRLAGNDIKSTNELGFAYLLSLEGKTSDANRICTHWKAKVHHLGDWAARAVKTNIPTPPLYDTSGVHIAEWDLACGSANEGLSVIEAEQEAHPDMLTAYTVLINYHTIAGDFADAFQDEKKARHSPEHPHPH